LHLYPPSPEQLKAISHSVDEISMPLYNKSNGRDKFAEDGILVSDEILAVALLAHKINPNIPYASQNSNL
jgi:hypothetical protein